MIKWFDVIFHLPASSLKLYSMVIGLQSKVQPSSNPVQVEDINERWRTAFVCLNKHQVRFWGAVNYNILMGSSSSLSLKLQTSFFYILVFRSYFFWALRFFFMFDWFSIHYCSYYRRLGLSLLLVPELISDEYNKTKQSETLCECGNCTFHTPSVCSSVFSYS